MASPFWDWVDHVVVAASATGAVFIWIARVLLVPGVKKQMDDMLEERFSTAKLELDRRHEDNRADLNRLTRALEESCEDRRQLHEQLAEVTAELAYLRGKTTGRYRNTKDE